MKNAMGKTKKTPRATLPLGIGKVLKRKHYPLDVILLCARWYVAYSLSLRNLEEMIAERGFEFDHSSAHRWVIKLVPLRRRLTRTVSPKRLPWTRAVPIWPRSKRSTPGGNADQDPAEQIPEQHRRAGPSCHQTHHQTDDGIQGFSFAPASC
jgi:Transposase and inactivated derivatives